MAMKSSESVEVELSHGFRIHASESFPKLTTVNSLIPPEELQNSKKGRKGVVFQRSFRRVRFFKLQGLHPSCLMSTSDLPQENIQ